MFHGQTIFGPAIDRMKTKETATSNYVCQLNEERRVSKLKHPEPAAHPTPKRCEYVFVDGKAAKRREGWVDNYFYCVITPGGKSV